MGKLNIKTTKDEVVSNCVTFLNATLEKKGVLTLAKIESANLKSDRKALYEDGQFLEGVALHSEKVAIEKAKKDLLAPINKNLKAVKESLVSKSFYEEYKLVTDKKTITDAEDLRWKSALASFLKGLGVGGTDNESNIDKFNPYRWTGKGKGLDAFRSVVVSDFANILLEKGMILYDENENVYKVA